VDILFIFLTEIQQLPLILRYYFQISMQGNKIKDTSTLALDLATLSSV